MDFNRYEICRAAFATDDVKICNECQIIVDDPNYDFVSTNRTDSPDNTALKCKNMVFLAKHFKPSIDKYFLFQCKLEYKSDLEEYYNTTLAKEVNVSVIVTYIGANGIEKAVSFNVVTDYNKTTLIVQRTSNNTVTCYTVSSTGVINNNESITNVEGPILGIYIDSDPIIANTYTYVDDIILLNSETDNNSPVLLPTQSLINNNVIVTSNSNTYATI